MTLDTTDRNLLQALQHNAQASNAELAEDLSLSASQISRRRARLEADGFIQSCTARLCPERLGLNVQAFIQVELASHAPADAKRLLRQFELEPRIISVWTLTGEADYLIRVYCEDLGALNRLIHETLLPNNTIARVRSQIVMDQPKIDSPLPVHGD